MFEAPELKSLTVIKETEDLEGFKFTNGKQLTQVPLYQFFLNRVSKAYEEYLTANPKSDKRDYQCEYAAIYCLRRCNIMGWSMRVGKTLSTLLSITGLYSDRVKYLRPCSIHIAVPSLLASMSWVKEMRQFPLFSSLYTVINSEVELLEAKTPIIIYRHDFVKNKSKTLRKEKHKEPYISELLARTNPRLLIVDEVHGVRNKSDRTNRLTHVRSASYRVLGLTGTPSEGKLSDIHNLMLFIYKEHWPYHTAEAFSKRFGTAQKIRENFLSGSEKNEEVPEKILEKLKVEELPNYYKLMRKYIHYLKITDPEVADCITIPEPVPTIHKVEPTKEQRTKYNEYVNDRREQLIRATSSINSHHRAEALQLINPLIEICNFPEVKITPKLEKVVELCTNAVGKVVVFCDRVMSGYRISQLLKERGINTIRVYAQDEQEEEKKLSEEDRISRVTSFQYDPDVKVGVFSINLAFQAIELNQASDVIYYDLPWSSLKIQQSMSRPIGPGNPYTKVGLHFLYQAGMIDEYQVMLAIHKIKLAKMLLLEYGEYAATSEGGSLNPEDVIRQMLSNN